MSIVHSSVVDGPIDEVFAWHARPGALPRMIPPWQPIQVLEEPSSLADGRAVLLFAGGLRWVAQHSGYQPPHRFVDHVVSPPLPWRHVHAFEASAESRTRVTDSVATPVPGRLLRQTFLYRHHQLADDLATHHAMARRDPRPLTVAVTGSSGLVGRALCTLLTTGGHRVVRLVRHPPAHSDERQWRPDEPDRALLRGVDAVVHLAGASIAGRFREAHRDAIRSSRIGPTRRLAELAAATDGPRVFVAASAIGFYGADRGDEELHETSSRGAGFLAGLVEDWEAATGPALEAGVRVVTVRTGIVQSPRGGVLRLLRPLFLAGLGGPIGSGRQWFSWIDLDDLTDIYLLALVERSLTGPLNAVAPEPVRFGEYAATLGRVLRRPALLRVPTLGPKIVFGNEGAREVALASQRVSADGVLRTGHRFRRPILEDSLRHQLGHRRS